MQMLKITTKDLKNELIKNVLYCLNYEDKIEKLIDVEKQIVDVTTKYKQKEINAEKFINTIYKIIENNKSYNIVIDSDKPNKFKVFLELPKVNYPIESKISHLNENISTSKKTVNSSIKNILYAVTWTERERDWGQRPDGITVHTSFEEGKRYLEKFLSKQPKDVPYEYTSPDYLEPKLVEVSDSIMNAIKSHNKNEHTLWLTVNDLKSLKNYDASHYFNKEKNQSNK